MRISKSAVMSLRHIHFQAPRDGETKRQGKYGALIERIPKNMGFRDHCFERVCL